MRAEHGPTRCAAATCGSRTVRWPHDDSTVYALHAASDSTLFQRFSDIQMTFERDAEGRVSAPLLERGDVKTRCQRIN